MTFYKINERASMTIPNTPLDETTAQRNLPFALLHLAPRPGELAYNRQLIESAVQKAAQMGARWIVTPELCVSGYVFAKRIGVDWIVPPPDTWLRQFCQKVAQLHVTVFLAAPEQDPHTLKRHNSVFVISENGQIIGKHRKINALHVGAEAWSSPGTTAQPVRVSPQHAVGLLICADACTIGIAESLRAQGAQLLISPAAWYPGEHGPSGEWEACTRSTGLPMFVCNRTGQDESLDFSEAESCIIKEGRRLFSFRSPVSSLVLATWDFEDQQLTAAPVTLPLDEADA
jgi:predicted amidohydrolase